MIEVSANKKSVGRITQEGRDYIFGYSSKSPEDFVSLTMPVRLRSYVYPKGHLHPIFEMNLPEGYLFELFKELLKKEVGKLDDIALLAALSPQIKGRLTYVASENDTPLHALQDEYSLDTILDAKEDLFKRLLERFLSGSAVSGIQPKVLADLKEKATLNTKKYIIKSFGEEFPHLCENEYFCLKVAQKAGLEVSPFYLSQNKKLLVIERFTNRKKDGKDVGFEEVCVLLGKNRDEKYVGSYEQVAKAIRTFCAKEYQAYSLEQLYKNIVVNTLVRNGDAHLKNFGIIYFEGVNDAVISPSYDIVTTVCYIRKDKPALTLGGKRLWSGKKKLLAFGELHCNLSGQKALHLYELCENALQEIKAELELYIEKNPSFASVGSTMVHAWEDGLKGKQIKEVDYGD